MAKHGRRRRKFRRYIRGKINFSKDLGTLNAKTGIRTAVTDVVDDTTWLSSVRCVYGLQDQTLLDNAGPIVVLVAHSDYTLAEVEEWIEATESWKTADLRNQEISRRKIRRIGVHGTSGGGVNIDVLNDGKPITTKCGWSIQEGQSVAFYHYNLGAAQFSSTPIATVQGHANLWPM